jgi:hypothetical protein
MQHDDMPVWFETYYSEYYQQTGSHKEKKVLPFALDLTLINNHLPDYVKGPDQGPS